MVSQRQCNDRHMYRSCEQVCYAKPSVVLESQRLHSSCEPGGRCQKLLTGATVLPDPAAAAAGCRLSPALGGIARCWLSPVACARVVQCEKLNMHFCMRSCSVPAGPRPQPRPGQKSFPIRPATPAAGLRLRIPGDRAIPTSNGAAFAGFILKGCIQCMF